MISYFIVKGDSMTPGYSGGDFVFIWKHFKPKVGDIVVVSKENKLMLKRIRDIVKDSGQMLYWLQGDNSKESYDSRNFGWASRRDILGKGVFSLKRQGKVFHKTNS